MAIQATERTNIKDFASRRSDMFMVPPNEITILEGWNGRGMSDAGTLEHIRGLKASISRDGVLEPLVCYVKDGHLYLNSGHCRLTAVRELLADGVEIPNVPVRVEVRGTNEADRILQQLTRNSGRGFGPLESAGVYKRLLGFGWSEQEISERSGRSIGSIRSDLDLLAAPAPITDMVRSGDVSASMAKSEIRKASGDHVKAQEKLTEAVKTAKDAGKKKAAPKHLAENSKDRKDAVADALKAAKRAEDGSVTLFLSADVFAAVCLACRVPVPSQEAV